MALVLQLPADLPAPLQAAFERSDLQAGEVFHEALAHGHALQRAQVLLALGSWHLHRADGLEAARWLHEGLALTRAQRSARPLQSRFWLGLSVASRLQGMFGPAEAYAATLRRSAEESGLREAALLAQASARRLGGDGWGSLTPVHEALHLTGSAEAQVARTLAWLTLEPQDTGPQAAHLAGQVAGALRSRLAWHLGEAAWQRQDTAEAERWLAVATAHPFASEEQRLTPQVAAHLGWTPPEAPGPSQIRVLTLERQGLERGGRFIPVPGDGRLLGLLAFLIYSGPVHWERAADAVLGGGARGALYGQLRHHLSTVRTLLGHPGAVTSRRGILVLDSSLAWSCDALDALQLPSPALDRPWLPMLVGWWVQDLRTQLSAGRP